MAPIAVDLDGNGVDPIGADESNVPFDWDGDDQKEHSAWVDRKDGFLVIDLAADGTAGADGVIDQRKELAFTSWAQWTTSDLEALRGAFDTNDDGMFDARDERWSEFRIWQDKNQNGISDKTELRTLEEWGFTSIALTPSSTTPACLVDGSAIASTSTVS